MAGKGRVFNTVVSMAGKLDPSLEKSIKNVEKKFDGVNVKAIAVGVAIGGIAIATGAAVVKSTKYLAELGDSYNTAVNDMSAATGLVGEELANMSDLMKDIYANNFGESMGDVAAGLTDVYRTTGLVNEELQAATEAGFALRDTFGYEMGESARAASAMMKNFGISAEEAYNLIAIGAQRGADQNGDLIDTLNEYSAQYAALGLDADQFITSLIAGNEAGVFSIDKVGDAVKEFNIRSKDMSKSSAEAYEMLGLDADKMFAKFSAGGDTAEKAMFEVIDALQNTKNASIKNAAAVGLFGTMYEDLESGLLPILATMEDATLDNVDALGQINDVKYDNLGAAFEAVKRQGEVALLPLASTVANTFQDLAPVIGDLFEGLSPIIQSLAEAAIPVINDIALCFKDIVPFVTDVANALIDLGTSGIGWVKDNMDWLLPIVAGLTAAFVAYKAVTIATTAATWAYNTAMLVLTSPIGLVVAAIAAVVAIGVALYQNWETICDYASQVGEFLSGVWESIKTAVGNFLNGIKEAFTTVFESLVALIKAPINAVISIINGAIDGINAIGFEIPDWVPVIGGGKFGLDIPTIPLLASGGFTEGVSIAGEAGTEAVISFDPAYRSENLSYWAEAGRMLGADASDYDLGTSTVTSVSIGDITFSPEININGNANKQDILDAIEETYPEFAELIYQILDERGVGVYA